MISAIAKISEVLDYIEGHLDDKLDLAKVAMAVHYSKYYLHRMFTQVVGMTLHDYIRRRRLTEAAKGLVFSRKPILEIAFLAGYGSQQAFSTVFKAMYKRTPLAYRAQGVFYPLQLAFTLNDNPSIGETLWRMADVTAVDVAAWMDFTALVVDGFPYFDATYHRKRLKDYIAQRQAVMMWDNAVVIGAAAFCRQKRSIDFLAVHPQYRQYGLAKEMVRFITTQALMGQEVSITTFRAGDKADIGQRAAYMQLGFVEAELSNEWGYPTQRLVLPHKSGGLLDG